MEKEKKTKIGAIEKHLVRYGSITDPVAREKYHTNRLSSCINILRKRKYIIETIMCEGRDEYGKHRYGKYKLISKPQMRREK